MRRTAGGNRPLTNADLFFFDLTGRPASASHRRDPAEHTTVPGEPFFGDLPGDNWIVIAGVDSAGAKVTLRPDDVVVRRRRHGPGWRCTAVADVDPRMLRRRDGGLPPDTLVLRRRDRRSTRLLSSPEPALRIEADQQGDEQAATSSCPLPKRSAIAYFFNAARYVRYNIATDAVDVGAAAISSVWHLPPAFHSNLDAAVNWGDGHVYLFKGPNYVRYNIATDRVDVGPVAISSNWRALPADFHSGLDAAVNWGDGHAYFFKGPKYVRYNIAGDSVDVGPTEIARYWKKLPADFQSNLDSVVNWGNGHAYFFKGPNYLRYVIESDTVDVGPVPIARHWPTLAAAFPTGVKAGVNWTDPGNLAEIMRAAGLVVNESAGWPTRVSQGEHSCFTPIGVIVHHTASTNRENTLADIVTNVKANFFVDKAGVVTVVSGGRANHAGKGAQQVLDEVNRGVAPTGTARARGLPENRIGNGHFYGFENLNAGDGVDPWPEVQLAAIARGAAALCQRHGWSSSRVISHAEWEKQKSDPSGIDMNVFRARVASHF